MEPRDLLAFILGAGAVVAVITLAVAEAVTDGHIGTDASTLFSTVLGAMIGAVATYIGQTTIRRKNMSEEPQTPDETEPTPVTAPAEPQEGEGEDPSTLEGDDEDDGD